MTTTSQELQDGRDLDLDMASSRQRNVLVGLTDHGAPRILSWVAKVAGPSDSVQIIEPYRPWLTTPGCRAPADRPAARRAASERHLRYAVSGLRMRRRDLAVDAELVDGTAGQTLSERVGAADLAVVGAPQTERERRTLAAVLASAHCPVLVVCAAAEQVRDDGPVRILLRDGLTDPAVLEAGFEQASARSAGLTVIKARDATEARGTALAETAEQKVLDGSIARYAEQHPDVGVAVELRDGTSESVVRETGRNTPLLVLGNEPTPGNESWILDPVLRAALEARDAPVLVVPSQSTR